MFLTAIYLRLQASYKSGPALSARRRSLKNVRKRFLPAVENFLKTQKNCLSEYVGSELTLKRRENKNMLEQQKKYHDARMDRDKELYERQIKIVDAQIDKQVYDLYGLTEEEVNVVEEVLLSKLF